MERIQPPFPATVTSLTGWVAELGTRKLLAKTIKAYLTGVRSTHIDMGFANLDVFHHPLLERIITGIRRLRGEPDTRERRPLTRPILLQILLKFDTSTQYGASTHAAFCVAFAGFMRIGEFTWSESDRLKPDFSRWFLTRQSVDLKGDHLILHLPASKTDPFRKGVQITIAATNDEACAVRSVSQLLARFPTSPSSPLFEISPGIAFSR